MIISKSFVENRIGHSSVDIYSKGTSVLEPLLLAKNLLRVNSTTEIFRVDSFSLMRGERVALVGPNGAGKTSLLLTLALLVPPTSGTIEFDGAIAAPGNLLALRRRMAVVFQESTLLDMTVGSNLATALRIRNVARGESHARVEKWLEVFGVAHLKGRQARSLSGGEAQRVSLARAFALEPDLLFLDEPFASLDYPTRNSLLEDLGQVINEMGMTTLFVTHDYTEIPHLAEKTAVMFKGQIIKAGSNREILGDDYLERRCRVPWEM